MIPSLVLSGTGDSQHDSRESIRANHSQLKLTRPQLGPFFVLKFVRSRGLGARFLHPFLKSLVTVKYYSNTKMAVNSR